MSSETNWVEFYLKIFAVIVVIVYFAAVTAWVSMLCFTFWRLPRVGHTVQRAREVAMDHFSQITHSFAPNQDVSRNVSSMASRYDEEDDLPEELQPALEEGTDREDERHVTTSV